MPRTNVSRLVSVLVSNYHMLLLFATVSPKYEEEHRIAVKKMGEKMEIGFSDATVSR